MSLDGPSYYDWTPGLNSTTPTTDHSEDVTPPSSPHLTPQGLRSFSDVDMPGGWRKSFGPAAAPPQSGPQRTNNQTRVPQRHEHTAPYNKDPSPGNAPPFCTGTNVRTGGGPTVPLQAGETLLADDFQKSSRPGLKTAYNQPAYKRQHANQRPCRPGSFTGGGNHVPNPKPPRQQPTGSSATAAQAHAQTRAYVQANFGFPPVRMKIATPPPRTTPATNSFMPTPPSHPSNDNDTQGEDDATEDNLRWRAARASIRAHRAAAGVRKARADLARYIDQREADTQFARDRRRREAERKRRNDLKGQQTAWWNIPATSSSPQPQQHRHQPQDVLPSPTPSDIARQLREIEEKERLRQAVKEEEARKADEQQRLKREEERKQRAAYQQQMLAEQVRQERLRRQAEEQAAAAREAERLRLLREQEEGESRERFWREQEEERMRRQAAWEEQQRHLYEEQQRKLQEEQERERQQREYADAHWREILQEQCRLAMHKMRTDAVYLAECRETYESTWTELSRPAPSAGCPQFINIVYFPWPCSISFALDVCRIETLPFIITAESVNEFLNRGVSDASEARRRLRRASARFHPDKLARIFPRLREDDREFVKAGFEIVQVQLNLLMEQCRQV